MKAVLRYVLFAGFFFMLGFVYEYHLPQLKIWTIVQIEQLSTQHLPVRILPLDIEGQLWPPGIKVRDIRIVPKAELANTIAPIRIQELSVQLRPQSLLTGDFKLSEIIIRHPEVTLLTDPKEIKKKATRDRINLEKILAVPIQEVIIEDGTIQVQNRGAELLGRIENLNLSVENRNKSLFYRLETSKALIKKTGSKGLASLSISLIGLISETELLVRGIKVKEGDSFLVASGVMQGDLQEGQIKSIQARSRAHIEIPSFIDTLRSFVILGELPNITGSADFEINFSRTPNSPDSVVAKFNTHDLNVNQFKIDQLIGEAELKDRKVIGPSLLIKNKAGEINLKSFEFLIDAPHNFAATVEPKNLELRQFLIQLDVGDSPLKLIINGNTPCQGALKPELSATCKGTLTGKDFIVHGNRPDKTIVALESFGIDGDATVTMKGIDINGKLAIGNSTKGTAKASIEYLKGFDISYATDELNFKDIKNLADLKIEGKAAIRGTTTGNSQAAKFQFKMNGDDIWFEDYGIGQASSLVDYNKGTLNFKTIEGRFNTTRYFAGVSVDLLKDTIKADGKLGFAEARDVQQMFSRKVELPFELFGNLAAKVSVSGPFEFTKLTYDLDTTAYRGSVGTEIFDEAKFHVSAVQGKVKTENVYIKKGPGVAVMTGQGYPNGNIDATIKGSGFKLEELSLFNQSDSTIQGSYNFDMSLKGHVFSPEAKIRGSTQDTMIGKDSVPPSKFELVIEKTGIGGSTAFLNDQVTIDFRYPFDLNTPFHLKADTKKWNFTPLFGLLSRDVATREFDTELTSQIHIEAKTGGFWKSTGTARVDTLRIKRGSLELFNPVPGIINFENGKMNIKSFLLQGDNTYLKAEAQNSTKEDLNLALNGKIELSLLAFLTPFLADLRGVLSVACQLGGNAEKPKLIGSAFIDKGYAKLRELPHAFENIKADILFSQQKVLVNSLNAGFAGGQAFAEGSIDLQAFKKFPTELRGHFDKVNLLVPKDFSTYGSGDFKITGQWFPFTLSGTYNISRGTISKEFTDQSQDPVVKRSSFLPSSLLDKSFSPLKFDLLANFPSDLMVKNTMIETEIRGSMKIQNTPEDPVLLGEVTAPPGGKIMFRDVPFEINGANLKFNNPNKINPTIYAQATSRIKDFDVNLLVQGTKEKYQLQLRSTPPLAEAEIISLLALGYTSDQLEKVQSDEQIDQQSYEIGSAIISNNPFGNEIRNKYGVNVRFGSAVDDENNVAPKVIVSKQWTNRINTSASRTIGNSVAQDVKLEYQLNKNISVIGSWEGKEYSEEQKASESESQSTDIFGLDLQYKMEFK